MQCERGGREGGSAGADGHGKEHLSKLSQGRVKRRARESGGEGEPYELLAELFKSVT